MPGKSDDGPDAEQDQARLANPPGAAAASQSDRKQGRLLDGIHSRLGPQIRLDGYIDRCRRRLLSVPWRLELESSPRGPRPPH